MGDEVGSEPLVLRGARAASSQLRVRAVRVERDQVPAPDVVAVVALAPVPGGARRAADTVEVVEVAARATDGVLVIPDRRTGQCLDPPPARAISSQVIRERPL